MAKIIQIDWHFDNKELIETKKYWNELNEELKESIELFDKFNNEAKKVDAINKIIKESSAEWRKQSKEIDKAAKATDVYARATKEATEQNEKLGNSVKEVGKNVNKTERSFLDLQRQVNRTKETGKKAMNDLGDAAEKASKKVSDAAAAGGGGGGGGKKKGGDGGGGGLFEKLGGMQEAGQGMLGDLRDAASGNMSSLASLSGSLSAIAGPAGMAAAAVAAVGMAAINAGNALIEDLRPKVNAVKEAFYSLTNEELKEVTVMIQGISNNFGGEFAENLDYVKQQMHTFGISAGEAKRGLTDIYAAMNPEQAAEAIEWANEYDVQMRKMGITAEETTAMLINSKKFGDYDDKALDSVKEYGVRINQLSLNSEKLIKDNGMFKFIQGVRDGKMTVSESIQGITGKMAELKAQGKDITPLTTAIFGSPGEDLGDRVLELGNMMKLTDEERKKIEELKAVNLEKAEAEAKSERARIGLFEKIRPIFEGGGLIVFKIWNGIKEMFFDLMSYIVDTFSPFIQTFKAWWDLIMEGSTYLQGIWDIIVAIVRVIIDIVMGLVNGAIMLWVQFERVKKALFDWVLSFAPISKAWEKLKIGFVEGVKAIVLVFKVLGYILSKTAAMVGLIGDAIVGLLTGKLSFNDIKASFRKLGKEMDEEIGKIVNKKDAPKLDDIKDDSKTQPVGGGGGLVTKTPEKDKKADDELYKQAINRLKNNIEERKELIKEKIRNETIMAEDAALETFMLDLEDKKRKHAIDLHFHKLSISDQITYDTEMMQMNEQYRQLLHDKNKADAGRNLDETKKLYDKKLHMLEQTNIAQMDRVAHSFVGTHNMTMVHFDNLREMNEENRKELLAIEHLSIAQKRAINEEADKVELDLREKKHANHIAFLKENRERLLKTEEDIVNSFGAVYGSMQNLSEGATIFGSSFNLALKGGSAAVRAFSDKTKTDLEKAMITIKSVADGLGEAFSAITAARIADLDKQVEANNKEIEQLKEKVELEKERNDELRARQEIDNKLAEIRIAELEALQKTLPEAEQDRVKNDIETQRKRITGLDKIKDKQKSKEEKRMDALAKKNEEIEKQKIKAQHDGFEMQRGAGIATALINTAIGVVSALKEVWPLNLILAASYGAIGATQVALIAAQENPYQGFHDGTLDVKGGISGRDSVRAMLEPGEAVIPTATNKDYQSAVTAIYNKSIPADVLNGFVNNYKFNGFNLDKTKQMLVSNNIIDTERIVSAIERKNAVNLSIDNDGLTAYFNKHNETTIVRDKKLRVKI